MAFGNAERVQRRADESETSASEVVVSPEILGQTKEALEKIIRDPDAYIDEGGAAWVYRLPIGLCIKVMRPHNENTASGMQLGNSLEEEAAFLEYLRTVVVEGARTPDYVSYTRIEETGVLIMEEIHGVNLQKILNGTEPLPPSYSHHAFFDALEKYVQALHETHHIAHGDLEPRNIMVEEESGMPRIIDFGRSVWTKGLDAEKRARLEQADWDALAATEEKMSALAN